MFLREQNSFCLHFKLCFSAKIGAMPERKIQCNLALLLLCRLMMTSLFLDQAVRVCHLL